MPEAIQLARALASGPTTCLRLTKQAMYASSNNTLEQQLALEAQLQREAGRSADFREGVTAFLEARRGSAGVRARYSVERTRRMISTPSVTTPGGRSGKPVISTPSASISESLPVRTSYR